MIMIIWEIAVFYITISHHFCVITRHIVTWTSPFHSSVSCAIWMGWSWWSWTPKNRKKALQWNGHGFGRTINWLFPWDETHSINWVLLVLITGISGHNCRGKKPVGSRRNMTWTWIFSSCCHSLSLRLWMVCSYSLWCFAFLGFYETIWWDYMALPSKIYHHHTHD